VNTMRLGARAGTGGAGRGPQAERIQPYSRPGPAEGRTGPAWLAPGRRKRPDVGHPQGTAPVSHPHGP
jgi:hypothetical protein